MDQSVTRTRHVDSTYESQFDGALLEQEKECQAEVISIEIAKLSRFCNKSEDIQEFFESLMCYLYDISSFIHVGLIAASFSKYESQLDAALLEQNKEYQAEVISIRIAKLSRFCIS